MTTSASTNLLPDFIGIGAQKAGTTWTYEQLKTHPEVFVPEIKELNFFFAKSLTLDWYQDQFRPARPGQKKGDISPSYAIRENTPQRIHSIVPGARLFYIARSPVARAFSQWKMARRLGNISNDIPFIEAFRQNLQVMQDLGDHAEVIRRFRKYFPLETQFRFFFYDDLCDDPRGYLRDLFQFLGIDVHWEPPRLNERVATHIEPLQLSREDEAEVLAFYRPRIEALEKETGRDLSHWKRLQSAATI